MKPLITTVRALKELATGLSPDAVESSPVLFAYATETADILVAANDSVAEQRIVLMRTDNVRELYVPDHLSDHRRDVISRMAAFAERARSAGSLSLPRGWHQYKHNSLIAFYAVPGIDSRASRWIAEVVPGDRSDVILWVTTTSVKKETLEEFDQTRDKRPSDLDPAWVQALSEAESHFANIGRTQSPDVEMLLPPLDQGTTKGWTYEQWLTEVSDDQRQFIDAPTNKSIRLRGPAGSGKTLALTLKAMREVLAARDSGVAIRVLLVTHSWSLASEIADSLANMGIVREIDVFPLLEIAQSISPQYVNDEFGFSLIGNDSLSGKQAQLAEIFDILDDFINGDWITYRSGVSAELSARFDSTDADDRLALAWDLLVEFGSVIGAAAIFPGAGAQTRYIQLARAGWMLPLNTREDLRVVFLLYTQYMESLDARSLLTSDQVLADLLNHLETHAWNRARRAQGYDLVFVDEFHLFSPLERQVLHYLSRDVTQYPRVFMAVDPRQSPSEAFIGIAADQTHSAPSTTDGTLGDFQNFDLTTVHRFTPQILDLIKHIHHRFPTLDLGHQWDIDFSAVESSQSDGPPLRLTLAASRSGEEDDLVKAIHDLYSGGRIALAIVDIRQWRRFSQLAARIASSGKFHVSTISGRSDIEGLGNRRRGLVVGPAEYLAGLQFETVLVAGVPDLRATSSVSDRTRFLSLLYLAVSRAEKDVRVFVNEDDGGIADVLQQAIVAGLLTSQRGSLV